MIDAEIINPFLMGAKKVLLEAAQLNLTIGKPYVRNLSFNSDIVRIIIGITGQMTGQVIIAIPVENAKQTASNMMMGMPVDDLNDMAISAISELGNMIMGTSSTIIADKGIITDITPPVIERGTSYMDVKDFQNICVPLFNNNDMFLELNIVAKKK